MTSSSSDSSAKKRQRKTSLRPSSISASMSRQLTAESSRLHEENRASPAPTYSRPGIASEAADFFLGYNALSMPGLSDIDLPAFVQLIGYPGIVAIIFAESGLFFAFFLRGVAPFHRRHSRGLRCLFYMCARAAR